MELERVPLVFFLSLPKPKAATAAEAAARRRRCVDQVVIIQEKMSSRPDAPLFDSLWLALLLLLGSVSKNIDDTHTHTVYSSVS